jgi:hypothetical protein
MRWFSSLLFPLKPDCVCACATGDCSEAYDRSLEGSQICQTCLASTPVCAFLFAQDCWSPDGNGFVGELVKDLGKGCTGLLRYRSFVPTAALKLWKAIGSGWGSSSRSTCVEVSNTLFCLWILFVFGSISCVCTGSLVEKTFCPAFTTTL